MRDKRDTYTSDGGGYAKYYGKAMAMRRSKMAPAYQTERSLASEPQSNQISNRRRPEVTQYYRPTAPEIDSKRIRTYWKSSDGSSGVKRTPTRKKGRWTSD